MKKNLLLSLFILFTLSTIVKADIKIGLVADFPFSGEAVDVSGNNYRATIFGATLTEDRFGSENSAYSFDWNQFIQTNVDGRKITDAMSISFWMKTSEIAYSSVWKCRDLRAYLISTYSAEGQGHNFNYCGQDNNADSLNFNLKLWDNDWHHLVINYNSSSISIYIDGNIFSTKNIDTFSFQGDFFKFGKHRSTTTAKYKGILDDIKIYNRILSTNDVWALYNENKQAPIAVTALSPKKINPPTYIWNAVPNSSWYYLWVNDSSGNKIKKWYTAAQAGCPNGTGICSVIPSVSLANGSAVWWVRTWNDFGYGSWNGATYFNVSN